MLHTLLPLSNCIVDFDTRNVFLKILYFHIPGSEMT